MGLHAAGGDVTGQALEAHEARPRPATAYTMAGPNTGLQANLGHPRHYPAEGICGDPGCGQVIRAQHRDGGWQHTGRMPGDPC